MSPCMRVPNVAGCLRVWLARRAPPTSLLPLRLWAGRGAHRARDEPRAERGRHLRVHGDRHAGDRLMIAS
eukprot:467628-Prymnesium_polylepis.1